MALGNKSSRRATSWARCRPSTPRRQDLPGGSYVGPDGFQEMRGHPTLVGRSAAAQRPDSARRLWEHPRSSPACASRWPGPGVEDVARHIALLRGINLGSRNRVPMPELRELLAANGYDDPRTLVQSGNVVLRAASAPTRWRAISRR